VFTTRNTGGGHMKASLSILGISILIALFAVIAGGTPAEAASRYFVTAVTPTGDTMDVPADTDITAKFSKGIKASTVKSTTFYLTKEGSTEKIPAQVTYSGANRTATLNPDSDLEVGATYVATMKGGSKGILAKDGSRLGGSKDGTATFANGKVTWSFTVANNSPPPVDECPDNPDRTEPPCDTTPPTVSSVTPQDGAKSVDPNTTVTATFSEPMKPDTVTEQSFRLIKAGSPVSAEVTYDENSSTATLTPDQALEFSTSYLVRLSTSVRDLDGNAMVQEKTWSFLTIPDSTTVPGVTSTPNPLHYSESDISPNALSCGPWVTKYLMVENDGPDNVTFADVSITGADAGYFSESLKPFLANNGGSATLLAGNHFFNAVTFEVGIHPLDRRRNYRATLAFKDQAGATIGNTVELTASARCLNVG
jgi:hypothetical protein